MNDLSEFLLTTGRTLSQMTLYAPDHPAVKGAVEESFKQLQKILSHEKEIVLSSHEGKLVVNGRLVEEGAPESATRPFIQLLTKFDLHSLSFIPGIEMREMIPFYRLASNQEIRKTDAGVLEALKAQGVTHIQINMAKYAKISEDETVGGKGDDDLGGDAESCFNEIVEIFL